jgi:hypothetical protein
MKWYGQLAYRDSVEVEPGIWEDQITEVNKFGDVLRNYSSNQQGSKINDDITVSNQISIIADPQLLESFHKIIYITFGGAKWRVSNVEVRYPRLIVTLGSLYVSEEDEDNGD